MHCDHIHNFSLTNNSKSHILRFYEQWRTQEDVGMRYKPIETPAKITSRAMRGSRTFMQPWDLHWSPDSGMGLTRLSATLSISGLISGLAPLIWHRTPYWTRMVWLNDSEKSPRICIIIPKQYRRVTDKQTDRWTDILWWHSPRYA